MPIVKFAYLPDPHYVPTGFLGQYGVEVTSPGPPLFHFRRVGTAPARFQEFKTAMIAEGLSSFDFAYCNGDTTDSHCAHVFVDDDQYLSNELTGQAKTDAFTDAQDLFVADMDSIGIPWHCSIGNHDEGSFNGTSDQPTWQTYFDITKNNSTNYGDIDNPLPSSTQAESYTFIANGVKIINLYVPLNELPTSSNNSSSDHLAWFTTEMLDKSRPIIILPHAHIWNFDQGQYSTAFSFTESDQRAMEVLIRDNGRVQFVGGGHHHYGGGPIAPNSAGNLKKRTITRDGTRYQACQGAVWCGVVGSVTNPVLNVPPLGPTSEDTNVFYFFEIDTDAIGGFGADGTETRANIKVTAFGRAAYESEPFTQYI